MHCKVDSRVSAAASGEKRYLLAKGESGTLKEAGEECNLAL